MKNILKAVTNVFKAIINVHLLDVSVCGAVMLAGFVVACKAIADVNPFWGMLAMILGASMLFCVIGEELDLHQQQKHQMLRPRSILDLPRNRRMS